MEAINISINKQSSVSINVETLQAIKQRVLSAVANWLRRYCSRSAIDASITALASSQHSSLFTFHFSLSRLYRKELRMARAVARAIDARLTLSNIFLWLMGIAIMIEVFLFA